MIVISSNHQCSRSNSAFEYYVAAGGVLTCSKKWKKKTKPHMYLRTNFPVTYLVPYAVTVSSLHMQIITDLMRFLVHQTRTRQCTLRLLRMYLRRKHQLIPRQPHRNVQGRSCNHKKRIIRAIHSGMEGKARGNMAARKTMP